MRLNRGFILCACAATLSVGVLASTKDQPVLTVEVLKAETVHWTTYLHSEGSAGTTNTDCNIYDNSVSCTSISSGHRSPATRPIYHTQVNLLVKMPDGNNVEVQCHFPPLWATCLQPDLGSYSAKINGHNVHLFIPVVKGRPKYNKDGTIKEHAKVDTEEVKFSFR